VETSLAIYEALIQANVPPPAARRVAETLEKDMSSNLATKQDLLLIKQDLQHFDHLMVTRFEALESRVSLKMENVESRVVIKLSIVMTALIAAAGTLLAVIR
jgi:hypothetical protein